MQRWIVEKIDEGLQRVWKGVEYIISSLDGFRWRVCDIE